ncbi:thiol reductant ABC exporter subunit CydD [Herbiconiux sp. CPCC 203407]|uniref:Thiol reductant ABC exporter subunit CydD n=1 Tax=Herbiconiux oxytropis TaxID=2970915 RepID=A0AA41XDN7_9MICO|nr:thiol reductant ABC exporter subunit CydD [Herbiconiux oxytropis]MCS5720858.1 thiol reductant ABC exporter subunit CydD [Herbiconiux oxytropis]MCS5724335.1 thiol reductant ABC exporter subunit CydD [Herbiconiux oxytropis]
MRPVDPRLLKYAASARAFFVAGGFLAVLQTGAVVAFAYLVTQLIVQAIDGASLPTLVPLLVGLAAVVVVRFVVNWIADVNAARGAAVVKSELRQRVVCAISNLGPGWLGRRSATAVGVTVGPGLDLLDTYFSKYLPQLILTAVATPVIVVVIWWQDWISGLTVALTLPLIPVFMILIGWATRSVQQKQWEKLTRLSSAFLDVVGGLSTLKIYGRQERQSARIRAVTEDYRSQTMKVLRVSFLSGFALELAASLSVALVAVSIGIRLIEGGLGLGVGLFVLLLAPEAFLPIRNVGAQFHAAADGVAASTEVFEILDAGAGVRPCAGAEGARPASPSEVLDDSSSGGGLELDGLGVRYGDDVVFSALDARFEAGAVTAVTGPSGSGKSSLVAALVGFVPAVGRILVDGVDASGQPAPRGWIAWAGQRSTLVSGSVLGNVALGDDAPDDSLARASLDLAGASDVDLAATIDARGEGLSGGQSQRVASARAVYRARRFDCRVVVFDEPTSALDAETEQAFIRCLRALADEGRVVLVVSHRRPVIAAADAVLALAGASALHARAGRS